MFRSYKSPNFNDRVGYDAPNMIVLHYTGMESTKAALERLCDPKSEVSAHYLIDEKGKMHELVSPNNRAWHAGVSYWGGEADINSASIGIEISNCGHDFGYTHFPEKQISVVTKLCKKLMAEYAISPARILGHSDIAPARKIDPGHLFPWESLARENVGLWPAPEEMDYQAGEDLVVNHNDFHELLCAYGYNPQLDFEDVVVEYHRHFYADKFTAEDDRPVEIDVASCAKLLSLIRKSHEV